VALLLAAGMTATVAVAPALADRAPSRAETRAIKRVALAHCEQGPNACRFHGARESTANPRFAWADVTAEGFSGVLLKRPSRSSKRFRVIGTQGGGIGECRYWRSLAPDAVLRDLRISGLVDATTGEARNCGRR